MSVVLVVRWWQQKTVDNYLFRRQFYNPTQLPLEREEQEVDSVTVESRERDGGASQ